MSRTESPRSMSVLDRILLGLATLGPIGTRLPAPGTFGSLAGLAVFAALLAWTDWPVLWLLVAFLLLALASVPLCSRAETLLDETDPGEVILDEFTAQPLVFLLVPHAFSTPRAPEEHLLLLAAGFALFRFFDVLKPLGIKRLQEFGGGVGVVADDLAAALAGGLVLYFFA